MAAFPGGATWETGGRTFPGHPQCCLYPLAQGHTAGWRALNGELLPRGLLTPSYSYGRRAFLSSVQKGSSSECCRGARGEATQGASSSGAISPLGWIHFPVTLETQASEKMGHFLHQRVCPRNVVGVALSGFAGTPKPQYLGLAKVHGS